MHRALKIIEKEIGEFNFSEIHNYEDANIKINFPMRDNLHTIGEASQNLDSDGNILGGEITIINVEDEGCEEYPDTEIHEILHIFGFAHNPETIMKEYSGGCQPLSSEWSIGYVEQLKFVYSSGKSGIEHPEIPYLEIYSFCEEGTYQAINDKNSCCPEPNMWVDEYSCYY